MGGTEKRFGRIGMGSGGTGIRFGGSGIRFNGTGIRCGGPGKWFASPSRELRRRAGRIHGTEPQDTVRLV